MKEEQVLKLKKQLVKQIEKFNKLGVSSGYLKNLKKIIIRLEEIINIGDYNSTKSQIMFLRIKIILASYKLQYQHMNMTVPPSKDFDSLHKELIAKTKINEKEILSGKK